MTVYLPYYNRGWHIAEIETSKARIVARGAGVDVMLRGAIYNGDNAFRTEAGAWAWIQKDYGMAYKDRVEL